MFVPGSDHVERNKKLGKKWDKATLRNKRFYLNLIDQHAVDVFFKKEKPEYVFLAAAKTLHPSKLSSRHPNAHYFPPK